jgi:hypothetical protein
MEELQYYVLLRRNELIISPAFLPRPQDPKPLDPRAQNPVSEPLMTQGQCQLINKVS